MGIPSVCTLEIHCCARQDKDGFKLAGVRDKVMGRITDLTQPDGCARIPLYRSYESQDWVQISSMKFAETIIESKEMRADDRTKFKIITTTLMWGAKI
ncbi:MAG: hypothetical protein GY865_17345 [candidate division Zixibacteria bacterium]|nr:hypothetical protein [candidate division Zixibacteria bacterium]